jgi:hypothetical protein
LQRQYTPQHSWFTKVCGVKAPALPVALRGAAENQASLRASAINPIADSGPSRSFPWE